MTGPAQLRGPVQGDAGEEEVQIQEILLRIQAQLKEARPNRLFHPAG